MKELVIDQKTSKAFGPFGPALPLLLTQLEGRKSWPNGNTLAFETTEFNLDIIKKAFPGATVQDNRRAKPTFENGSENFQSFDFGQGVVETPGFQLNEMFSIDDDDADFSGATSPFLKYFKTEPYDYQIAAFEHLRSRNVGAIFSEQGTGKTKTAIDLMSYRRAKNEIEAVLILSWPKGVHSQWIESEIPKHVWDKIDVFGHAWNGKEKDIPAAFFDPVSSPHRLKVFSLNIETLVHARSLDVIRKFINTFKERCMIIVDESQSIKSATSKRWKNLDDVSAPVVYRLIMTGTPIAKDLVDEWSQFKFLDERIIGIRYKTAFQSQFCVMGGFENRQVIAHRNIETFKKLTSPYIFRATKKMLNLPDKTYNEIVFDLSPEQRRLIKDVKDTLSAELEDGTITSAKSAIASLVRIQQISNGFVVDEDSGDAVDLKVNPRLDALERTISGATGKVIVWSRFRADVESICKRFGKEAVDYYGGTKKALRPENLEAFKDPESPVKYLVASPAAAGSGIDGLQKVCSTAVYYSNSFNAIDRWQSEDRIHRIGMGEGVIYHDLIGRGSMDRALLANIKKKRSLADFVLDDVKGFVNEL